MMRIHHDQILGLGARVSEAEVGKGPNEKASPHEVPFGIRAAHPIELPLAKLWVSPERGVALRELTGGTRDSRRAQGLPRLEEEAQAQEASG